MRCRAGRVAALLAGVAAAGMASAEPARSPAEALTREIYEELIEIDTTHTSGDTTLAAEAMARRLREAGVPEADVRVLGPAPKKGNLVARLRGAGEARPLLLLAHLDVVEARREDWSFDPFTLLEQDGFFYGRGTLDDKAMAAIFTAEMIALARERAPLRRDVILALTADEEGGTHNGVDWLLREHRELVDAALVLNEGGGGRSQGGRRLSNAVQASEKIYQDFELAVRNRGGHSSLPTRDNAIYRLAAGLENLARHRFPVELDPVTREYLARTARVERPEIARAMRALLDDPGDAEAAAALADVPSYDAALRTTCVATQLDAGHARNALPQLARANVNCRILPGHSAEEVRGALVGVLGDPEIAVRAIESEVASPALPIDPELLGQVEAITESLWPGVPVIPTMSPGATDSKYFRRAGIPAYGVSGIFVDIDDIRAHGRDERVGVQQFYEGREFLHRLVSGLARAPG
jgi:acetylornithine deacetylase/succinyl-diaminopimelate desuccinylase-like protein